MNKNHKLILASAKRYQDNLVGKNMLVIHQNRTTKKYLKTEFVFYSSNFLHFTGVDYRASTVNNKKSDLFFNKCINNELSLSDYQYRDDGTTRLKLDVLAEVVNIHKVATMIGDYNNSRPKLVTDKLYGNIRASIGAVATEDNYFVPNTALKEDIRNIVSDWQPIKAIYIKDIGDEKYHFKNCTKISKDFDLELLDETIRELLILKNDH